MSDVTAPVQDPTPAGAMVKASELPSGRIIYTPENEAGSIVQLLHLAVEKGTPVESLEKLVALHERLSDRKAAQEFAAAMAAFQAECPPITHSKQANITTNSGSSYSYTYAELDAIARVANPILAKHGLSYSWNTSVDEKNRLTCECVVRHLNGHIAPPATFSLPIESKSAMSEQQKVGAAATFAKRQTLIAALGITTSDDDFDGAAVVDPKPINQKQLRELEDLVTEVQPDLAKFYAFLGVEQLDKLPASRYREAIAFLRQKQQQLQGKAKRGPAR